MKIIIGITLLLISIALSVVVKNQIDKNNLYGLISMFGALFMLAASAVYLGL